MKERSCKCLICETRRDLSLIMESPARKQVFRSLAIDFSPLAEFDCPMTLINHLHRRDLDTNQLRAADRVLGFLIRGYAVASADPIFSELLVLGFFPALHATYREICAGFPNLLPEDVAQQAMLSLLRVAHFPAIQNLNHHVSVTFARTLRTVVRRWAMKQTRELENPEPIDNLDPDAPELRADGNFESTFLLEDFLNQCCINGILSKENYEIFVKLKLEGFEAKDLAAIEGSPSAMAIHQRIHRIMDRLRQRASG